MKKLLSFAFILALASAYSQQRTCGTQTPPQKYETWVSSLQGGQSGGPKGGSQSIQSVFNIPVIVHIIHNNENINSPTATSGNNLNAAQVINQINILNNDFKTLNPDTSLIPTVFKPALGRMQLNFCLAVVNPTGGVLAEPGIDRINRVSKGWNASPYTQTYIDGTIKPNSIWDPNRYLNIWVCALGNSLLGYATFPNPGASGLGGFSAPYGSATSDGVVILNTAFGSIGTAVSGPYNLGRTATHEIGHWVGLRHVWGDGTCATDYCNDTPPAQTANYNCPTFPYKLGTCSGNTTGEMTMNYMDYTNDACMYMFTKDQVYRAQLIMANSPIRMALATSTACNLPAVGTDAGISSVARPTYSQVVNCNNFIDPILNITNYGITTLTTLVVSYKVDASATQSISWTGSANPNTTFTVAIPQIGNLSNGPHAFSATLSAPNGTTDVNSLNNTNIQLFTIANQLSVTVNTPTTCAGVAVTLTASGATSYVWTNVGNTASVSVRPTTTTIYTVTASNSNCSVVRTTTVGVGAGPILNVSNGVACAGATVNLGASGANTYTWSTGATTNSIIASGSSNTTYTVVGSTGTICDATKIVSLTILPSPTLAVSNLTICPGLTATLSASGASTYSWTGGATSSSITVTPANTTTYQVTGTSATCSDTKSVSVTIGSSLSLLINPAQATICAGGTASFVASGANSYTWSSGGNGASILVNPSSTTVYTLTGNSANCLGSKLYTVTVNTLPIVGLTATNITCFGQSNGQVVGSAQGANPPFVFSYPNGSVNLSAGIYSVSVTDNVGCVATTTTSITQPAAIVINANGGITTCPGACNGTAQITPTGGVSPFTATLFPGGANGLSFNTMCAGNYNALVTDANGCISTGTFAVAGGNVGVQITSTVTNVSCATCSDATLSANGSGGTAPYSYTWTPGNFFGATIADVPAGCYTVTVKDAQGCSSEAFVCASFDVGIRNNVNTGSIRIQPNPSEGVFLLTGFTATSQIIIYDVQGRLIRNVESLAGSASIDLSNYADGIYYARIISDNSAQVIQLMKH